MTTPEHKAAEYATKVANGCSPDQLRHICERTMRHFLAGHAAGKQDERERILAILDHGCGQAPVQFTYAELRREIHEITEEDCYTGGEKV